MNTYDFDKTIHRGDSSLSFYFYCLLRRPYLALLWPLQGAAAILYKLRIWDKTQMKQVFYLYFRLLNAEKMAEAFWAKRGTSRIFSWYFETHREDDIIVSASPAFFLKPICKQLGIRHLLASQVDPKTGRYSGKNCTDEEKVLRLQAEFPQAEFECCYYDSDSDLPMARLAKRRLRVIDGVPHEGIDG